MADESHLERMGRELKCPICLSLLSSAVSLTCNHVFCNSCIQKSMKAASNCPVCKVPFRRREIRAAPHMNNLVSVYKSMEVASGANIFVTQTAASTKVSGDNFVHLSCNGEDKQAVANIGESQDNGKNQLESLDCENVKKYQRKGSKTASMTTQSNFGPNIVKSSFPTKKRVQLPMCHTSENRLQHENLGSEFGETGRNSPQRSHAPQEDMPSVCENGEAIFPPFFWLREEEDEKSSLQTDDDQLMYTPPDAPCFSDIKESDDEGCRKLSPERGTCTLPSNADFIDSEMFDWTQRPCSPELFSSPLTMQIEDTFEDAAEDNGAQANADATLTNTITGLKVNPKGRKVTGNKRRAVKISDKKDNVQSGSRQSKRAKKTCHITSLDTESDKVTDQDVQDGNKDKLMKLKGKSRQDKQVRSTASVQETASENVLDISYGTETMTITNKTAFPQFSASEDLKKSSKRSSKVKTNGKNCKSTTNTSVQSEKFGSKKNSGKSKTDEVQINTDGNNEVLISKSQTNLSPLGKYKKVSARGRTRPYEENIRQSTNSRKKVTFCEEGMSRDNCDSNPLTTMDEEAVTDKNLQEIHGATDQGMKVQAKVDKTMSNMKEKVLVKCKTFPSKSRCAFCLSSEESEASGIMVHYLKGKLVADNQNTRTNAIHVHKTCTEWAPNVYFDNDDVFNLETELSRSRRIKCSCCGIKGAALGCYEKSCRKSFHVPCAKMTPECRWDYENYVMLCPLHATCQLPNEIPQSESKHKRKSADESRSCPHQVKTIAESKTSSILQWKSQKKFKNLVLCCSALSNIEKGIVSEYEKLSGVTILKNWDSSVTHVITSTDENGACRRTLKFLMGVLEGKWILNVQWIKACMEAGELVDEQQYEISVDIHGTRDGPRLGRLRLLNKQPKLFNGYTFFFTGDFVPSYKRYLHDLVIAAGGKVLNRKPVAGCSPTTFIIYSVDLPEKCKPSDGNSILNQRRIDAEALATSATASVASNSWILNSISGYKLQNLAD